MTAFCGHSKLLRKILVLQIFFELYIAGSPYSIEFAAKADGIFQESSELKKVLLTFRPCCYHQQESMGQISAVGYKTSNGINK
jgi:hypothetical protein